MWVMGIPLSGCAFALWKGDVSGHHFTRYGVVRLGLELRRGCFLRSVLYDAGNWGLVGKVEVVVWL